VQIIVVWHDSAMTVAAAAAAAGTVTVTVVAVFVRVVEGMKMMSVHVQLHPFQTQIRSVPLVRYLL